MPRCAHARHTRTINPACGMLQHAAVMGQLLTLSLRDYPQGGASTITRSPYSRTTEAQVSNEAQGLALYVDHERKHEVRQVRIRLGNLERSEQRKQGLPEAASPVDVLRSMQDAKSAQKAAEQRRRKALAEEMARTAAESARKAVEARDVFRRHSIEGIQPFVNPSFEEFATAKRRIQYQEGYFHFAVAGTAGSGKSSVVNALRGLRSRDVGAAPVGIVERALQVARYPDPNPENPFVWYEIPGAGAIKRHDWQYFHDQGLFVFDAIIIIFEHRFTLTDVAILANARRFDIPTYIVRSKADRYIRNIMSDMGYDSNDDKQGAEHRDRLFDAARKRFVGETRKCVQLNLEYANLPDQRVYIVSNSTLLSIVGNKMPKRTFDEVELLHDLFNQVDTRQVVNSRM